MIASALLCLALNVFYEARNTTDFDREAVAAVALNRSEQEHRSVCKVIAQPKQFSWTSRYRMVAPKSKNVLEKKAWSHALEIARTVLTNKRIRQRFANVYYYHTHYVKPVWDRHMRVVFNTPAHLYYMSS
jgi:N-acetylmuramoyl-L-alanine amidase